MTALSALAGRRFRWTSFLFLLVVHLLGGLGIWWLASGHFRWPTMYLTVGTYLVTGLGITGAYHRLFTHRAYQTYVAIRLAYLVSAAGFFGTSALEWCTDHRRHHAKTDKPEDPYNATFGFWWSHVGWIIFYDPRQKKNYKVVKDLLRDPWVVWQYKYFYRIAVVVGIILPVGLATLWGDPWGGFLVAVGLRVMVGLNLMFSVNSFAHLVGGQTWSKLVSARDNWLATVLVSVGILFCAALIPLGYVHQGVLGILVLFGSIGIGELVGHSWHHRFQRDYRNGPRLWLDPTGWWIWSLEKLGLAWDLHRTTPTQIAVARREVAAQ